ncbi:hypothetical protein C1645_870650 [Glomus cerebriforme]|uniref:HAD-like domain-containing protein n=1 Tax=Glomus cerebriforme TaxID=658196 RepID=A0A397TK24_9GLOM|nr:hypothetical protein C1645_870650 [Glomus cerebriforme]
MCTRLVDLLVCDFDETITQNDSICELANLAYEKRARTGKCPTPPNCPSILSSNDNDEECPPPWSYFVELYFKEYKEHIKRWREQHSDKTLHDHFKMLESLKKVENISIDRIEAYGCMKGVCYHELVERGKLIKKKDDALDILRNFISKEQSQNCHDYVLLEEPNSTFTNEITGRNLYIISTNWSKDIILGSLFELTSENKFDRENIFSNDLVFNNDDCSIGKLDRKVLCANDKLKIFSQLNTSKSNMSVYIGDSDTDLPCLLQADIGIIMGNNRSLTKHCYKYEIEIVEGLADFESCNIDDLYGESEQRNKLYRIQTWKEISDSGLLD